MTNYPLNQTNATSERESQDAEFWMLASHARFASTAAIAANLSLQSRPD
ncbi:hypothetical protein [Lacticaseibacillus mingshuiensis]|nr:hypothetical protein [Lacticaseibacillus mingshuiensis]